MAMGTQFKAFLEDKLLSHIWSKTVRMETQKREFNNLGKIKVKKHTTMEDSCLRTGNVKY